MKKYFLVTAISAALLLTACGSNQNNTAETSATSAQTSETTLNNSDNNISNAELSENEYRAYITDVLQNKNGGYSLVVEAYDVMGYYSPVRISLYSENEFEKGNWVKVEFAPETCFMETSPLQVNKSDILNIELIDY